MHEPLYPLTESRRMNRRSFVCATSSLAAAALWSNRAAGIVKRRAALTDHPFQLGVASGDPAPDGVVLWTRLAPRPLEGGGMPQEAIEVAWQVAEDERFAKVVRRGTTTATPDWAHSVHVEVDGLQPGRWYYYQFQAAGEISPTGRTRTLPAVVAADPRLRFAFASCQHYEAGLFTAYEHMAAEDLDLVVHLGDYIYEGAGQPQRVRQHVGPKLTSLDDYRNRHAQYKTDGALQAMHAAAPWIVTWDDHEVENNYAGDVSERLDARVDEFLQQRAVAYRAYYEHMPLRRANLPHGPAMPLYRRIPFGRLAEFFVLDTRQYRTDQPCGDKNRPPCEASFDPQASLLGSAQREWLFGGLSSSPATWNVLAQQVMMARVDFTAGEASTFSMDQWPGYEAERRRVLAFLGKQRVANPVVLTGDIHSNWANELLVNFDDADSRPVATEFVGTSISSSGDGTAEPERLAQLLAENPFVKYHNAQRGYVRCQVSPGQWQTDYRLVEYVTRPGAPIATRRSLVVEAGRPQLHDA